MVLKTFYWFHTRTLSEDGDPPRVSSEHLDVPLDPLQSLHLVHEAVVSYGGRRHRLAFMCPRFRRPRNPSGSLLELNLTFRRRNWGEELRGFKFRNVSAAPGRRGELCRHLTARFTSRSEGLLLGLGNRSDAARLVTC